jgi:hypothetical protein
VFIQLVEAFLAGVKKYHGMNKSQAFGRIIAISLYIFTS